MVSLLLTMDVHGQPPPAAGQTGNADAGKKLYNSIGCWECHGYSGQGGGAGPKIARIAVPLPAFDKLLRAPKGEMPPYSAKVLSDQEVADILAFLKSIPAPKDVKEIPLLNSTTDQTPAP